MGVKEPSVSRAVGGLVKEGLVRHEVYGKIELTDKGRAVGAELIRRTDCLSRLLVDLLSMPPEAAAAEVHRMEHVLGAAEVHRMEHVLGDEVLSRLEVLVDFAASSPAWLKRLHYRIRTEAQKLETASGYELGAKPIHGGTVGGQAAESAT
jgi:Mn-dependent DtxR family transcriptional regulator